MSKEGFVVSQTQDFMMGFDKIPKLKEPHSNKTIWASMAWKHMSCPRRAFYDATDPIDDKFDGSMRSVHGKVVGAMLVDAIKKMGRWRGDEVSGSNEQYRVAYRIDCLYFDGTNVVPMEIKSCNNATFWEFVQKPNTSHLGQLNLYLGFHLPEPYAYGYLLLYNKDTDEVYQFKVQFNKEYHEKMLAVFQKFNVCMDFNMPPDCCADRGQCRRCVYEKRCAGIVEEDAF